MVEQILRMLLANDEGGLVLLKQEFGARINYIVKSILTNEEAAAECINDIYFSVWRNAASYDSAKTQVTTWLTVVCRNTALNVAKKKNLALGSLNYNLTSDSYLPEDELPRQEREAALNRAIALLTKRELQLFYRKYYYCQSTAQIAAELNSMGCRGQAVSYAPKNSTAAGRWLAMSCTDKEKLDNLLVEHLSRVISPGRDIGKINPWRRPIFKLSGV